MSSPPTVTRTINYNLRKRITIITANNNDAVQIVKKLKPRMQIENNAMSTPAAKSSSRSSTSSSSATNINNSDYIDEQNKDKLLQQHGDNTLYDKSGTVIPQSSSSSSSSEKIVTTQNTSPWYIHFTKNDPDYNNYMSTEWGYEKTTDDALFEKLSLELSQAGLSWKTILNKRQAYRKTFHNFNIEKVAQMKVEDILHQIEMNQQQQQQNQHHHPKNGGNTHEIVKHRGKIEAIIHNARQITTMKERDSTFTTFTQYIWSFVNHQPILNEWKSINDIPNQSLESETMSRDMKKRHGFKFVGPTTCYSFMQSCGLVIDHPVDSIEWNLALQRLEMREGGYQKR